MSAFKFETISSSDAASFGSADTLAFGGPDGASASVAYAADHVTITYGGRSVDFGLGVEGHASATFADGSGLFIGGGGGDSVGNATGPSALYGGDGGDSLQGGTSDDLVQGNQGDDTLAGGLGNDVLYGGQGNDNIHTGVVVGPGVDPVVSPATESNFANGNKGDDVIVGGPGQDTLLGGQGNDMIDGGGGSNLLDGNLGDDIINGGAGADTIIGEGGQDFLTGGGGADLFVFAAGSSDAANGLPDTILDWNASDHIHIDGITIGFTVVAPAMTPGYSYGGYNYPGTTDTSYAATLGQANSAMHANPAINVVAGPVGGDTVLFVDVDGDHNADLAITLSNIAPGDVTAANFV